MIWLILFACNEPVNKEAVPSLGWDSVQWTLIGDETDGLNVPRDLGFNPDRPSELWVVNRADDSTSIFFDLAQEEQRSAHIIDPFAEHFMEEVSSIEFGDVGTFGTCQESKNTYNGTQLANSFMGPTLWSTDFDIYGESNPDAIRFLGYDLGSHLDMLHQTPLCMGIAWEGANVYWAFNGNDGSIDRNDFHEDHGPGFDDHSDGTIFRYGIGEFSRVPDVPSHMKFDHSSALLYIADTGNNSIKVLDTTAGDSDQRLPTMEPGTVHMTMANISLWTLVEGSDFGMERPSGLTIINDLILVTDNATSKIFAFDLDGELVSELQTDVPSGGLMGIYASSINDLWVVNAVDNEVWRIQPEGSDLNRVPESEEYTHY